jgi:hypothetical protein
MKNYLIFILLLFGFEGVEANAANPKFFIVTQSKSDLVDAKSILPAFETELFKDLMKTFPCIDYLDQGSLGEMLRWERMRQLLGSGSDEELKNIAGGIGSDYLIKFTVTMMGNQMYMNAFCMDSKKATTMARADASGTIGQAISNAKKVSKDLVKQLEEYEICAFKGPVTIEVKSNRDEKTSSSVPCDNGLVTTDFSLKSNSTLNWKLNKSGLRRTSGTASYNSTENVKTVITNSCYVCTNGVKGSATITETTDSEAKVEGLSKESVSEGHNVEDARVKIYFLENGTYTLLVEATSKKGVLKVTTEKKIDGPCNSENENKPKDTKNKSIDVPIKAVFGPYPGKPSDKVLQQKETKDVSQGQEKTTVTIDFTLTRNDKSG